MYGSQDSRQQATKVRDLREEKQMCWALPPPQLMVWIVLRQQQREGKPKVQAHSLPELRRQGLQGDQGSWFAGQSTESKELQTERTLSAESPTQVPAERG